MKVLSSQISVSIKFGGCFSATSAELVAVSETIYPLNTTPYFCPV